FEWVDDTPADTAAVPADKAKAPADDTATGTVGSTDKAAAPVATVDRLNRDGLADFDEAQLTADELKGINVYGTNDEHIGTIGDLALTDDGKVDALIIDFGGFLGIGTKPVAVAFENLDFLADPNNNRSLVLPITREQMEAAPAFNKDTYTAERDAQRVVVGAKAQS
ncbi:MAG: PRC-barrel domain containing protein, partial [Hyphomicrobiales bacterium]